MVNKQNIKIFKNCIYPLYNNQVADWLGVTQATLSNWCNGHTPITKLIIVAVSRENLITYVLSNPFALRRIKKLAETDKKGKKLLKDINSRCQH